MKFLGSLLTVLFCVNTALAQEDTAQLTNKFEFTDGIYATFEDFKNNKPTWAWEEVNASAHLNREKYLLRFEYLLDTTDERKTSLSIDSIWGVSVEGVPYIQTFDSMRQVRQFVGLRTRGRICYFYYPSIAFQKVPITIYDPVTQQPVYTQPVTNKVEVTVRKMLDFNTGSIADFSVATFLNWIGDDIQLKNTIEALSEDEAGQKLYRTMLIYNDRNPVFIKKE